MQHFAKTYAGALPWLLLIFVSFYFFDLASFPVSIDEEMAAFRTDPSVWVSQGRWGAYLIELLVLPKPSVPVVSPAIFGICAALAFLLVLDASRPVGPLRPTDFLTFVVFCAYPTWFFIAEFYPNLYATGIGLLLSALAVWLLMSGRVQLGTASRIALATICGALAIGIYQSFLFLLAAMLVGVVLLRCLNGLTRTPWRDTLNGSVPIVAAAIIYVVLDKVFRVAFPARSAYFDSLSNFDALLSSPLLVLKRILSSIANSYGMVATDFGAPLWSAAILLALGLLVAVLRARKYTGATIAFLVLAPIFVLAAPFIPQIAAGGLLPYRAFIGVPFAMWLMATIAIEHWRPPFRNAALVVTAVLVFQSFVIANLYQASQYFSSRKDLLLAGEVSSRIFGLPEYDPGKTYYLALFGSRPFVTSAYPQPYTSTIGHSFFEWDGGNAARISYYLRLLGYPQVNAATPDMETRVIETLAAMPVFPAPGSVAISQDIILLRLGEAAQWRNTQTLERAKGLAR